MYNIDRKTAGKLLKVTIRTVDRYIASKKLSSQNQDGRIRLDKSEVIKLRAKKRVDTDMDMSTSKMSIDNLVSTPVDMSIDSVHIMSTSDLHKGASRANITGEGIYKNLFEELQKELRSKQERLEGANYRVGQLEALLKETVPLLDHQRALLSERNQKDALKHEHESLKTKMDQLMEKLKDEKLSKRVFLIVLFILMFLQPLWLILSLKH